MESYLDAWTERDFDSLSWHDCNVHGIRFHNSVEGYNFDLVLDIDEILEWFKTPQGRVNFVVAPALLTFRNVDELVIDLELAYKEDLEVDSIEREDTCVQGETGSENFRWIIRFHSLAGHKNQFRFRSGGFALRLTGQPRKTECQRLQDHER
jgi:hypothetical protein